MASQETGLEHGGNLGLLSGMAGCRPVEIMDFSANINCFPAPGWLPAVYQRAFAEINHYPEPRAESLRSALSTHWRRPVENILAANGSGEIFFALARLKRARRILTCMPCYAGYAHAAGASGRPHVNLRTRQDDFSIDFAVLRETLCPGDMLILGHPNNPDGRLLPLGMLSGLVLDRPEVTWVVDESFIDFCGAHQSFKNLRLPNLVVVHSFTKFFAIPGLRFGAVLASAEIIAE